MDDETVPGNDAGGTPPAPPMFGGSPGYQPPAAPAPGPAAPPPRFGGGPGHPAPGVVSPAPPSAQPWVTAPSAYEPRTAPTSTTTGGLPPSVGLAVVLLSFPAMMSLLYGLSVTTAGLIFSSTSSNSEFFGNSSDIGRTATTIGLLLLAGGVFGIVSTVAMAAGSSTGRLCCTAFIALLYLWGLYQAAMEGSPGAVIGLLIVLSPGMYCLWAMWSGRGREVF